MPVFRTHKDKNFTAMSNIHLRDKNLSLRSKGLLSVILSLPEDWNYSIAGLSVILKDGKDSVRTAIKELEKFNYVKRTQTNNPTDGHIRYIYDVYEKPLQDSPLSGTPTMGTPSLGNPSTGTPTMGTPSLGNPTQINKEQSNTEELSTEEKPSLTAEQFTELWNIWVDKRAQKVSHVKTCSPERIKKFNTRQKAFAKYGANERVFWERLLYSVANTREGFYIGNSKGGWTVDFDWLIENNKRIMKFIEAEG